MATDGGTAARERSFAMSRRLLFIVVFAVCVIGLSGLAAASQPTASSPTGERVNGAQNGQLGTTIEPVYDDMTGAIRYVSTPNGTAHPVPTNPRATAPFYLPVYPTSSTVVTSSTLNCEDTTATTTENCPDHGPAVAGLAQLFEPGVYGTPGTPGVVAGHDHLMSGPGSGGDFNVAWVPTLLLFTSAAAANEHILSLAQINADISSGAVIKIPLNGTPFEGIALPNLTFHCSVVSAAVYAHSVPVG
jgi:hypothetical protein